MAVEWRTFEQAFSAARVGRYLTYCHNDRALAMEAYRHNLIVAGAVTPFLGVVEVSLRNAVSRQLAEHYGRADWWAAWDGDPLFQRHLAQLCRAKAKLRSRWEPDTPDKIVAELTLGFWVILFNAEFQSRLWKSLRRAFRHLPKAERQRHHVSPLLNRLRLLRNRAFHHEPILWLTPVGLPQIYKEGLTLLAWIDEALPKWCLSHCQVQAAWGVWNSIAGRAHPMTGRPGQQHDNAAPSALAQNLDGVNIDLPS